MGSLQEFPKDAELVHDFEGGGMDRVAAKVAQEVDMLFENQDRDPGSGQQQCQHHSGGTPAGDAATDRNLAGVHRLALPRECFLALVGASAKPHGARGEFSVTSAAAGDEGSVGGFSAFRAV